MKTNVILLLILSFFVSSCVKDVEDFKEIHYLPQDYQTLSKTLNLPDKPFNYTADLPQYLMSTGLSPNIVSNNRATLGRVLFYDKSLSKTGEVSCASCHKQELAFADNAKFSKGINNQDTDRNSIALGSVVSFAAYYGGTTRTFFGGFPFFWDERAANAAEQSQMSLTNSKEMGMSHADILSAVQGKEYYEILFKTAFKDPEITVDKILLGLEAFVDGIGSFQSKLDQAADAEGGFVDFTRDFRLLSAAENRGKTLFINNCGNCHGRETGRPGKANANNGLDMIYADKGVGAISKYSGQYGNFKVPALRNVALTAPYMHDGRFDNLEQVLDFYSSSIQEHKNLDPELRNLDGSAKKFNFTDAEKQDLIAFMNTLTDSKLLSDEKYSDPFK